MRRPFRLLVLVPSLLLLACGDTSGTPQPAADTGGEIAAGDTVPGGDEGSGSDVAEPDVAEPDAAADTATPDADEPDVQMDAATPDASQPDAAEDVATNPDATEPDATPAEDVPSTPDAAPDAAPDATADVPGDAQATPDAEEPWPTEPPAIVATHATFIGDWKMTPGQETTKCVVRRLDNETAMWVHQIRTKLGQGSHHMIVYKSSETEEKTTPFTCDPFVETLKGETVPLMITQIPEETLTFPIGVAFKFEPKQMVRIEAHYMNYYPSDITAHGDVWFDAIADEDVKAEGDLLFYGAWDFSIPAGKTVTLPWQFLDVLPGTKVFAMTGHTHAFGDNVEVAVSSGKTDPGQSIYPAEDAPYSWSEPPVVQFDPPLEFGQGDGFQYRCTWTNTSNKNVGFGESAGQEMCFFWAYYYPSQGYRMCVNAGQYSSFVGDSVCCPDSPFCDLITDYLQ